MTAHGSPPSRQVGDEVSKRPPAYFACDGSQMTAVSLFSGVGGMDLACELAGIRVVATAEIDKHARKILARHFPAAHHYDDVKAVTHDGLLRDTGVVPRMVIGGWPCQDLSIGWTGAGLAGERSGLFWEAIRVARDCLAEWVVIENVPGLLRPRRARDMGTVVGALADSGYGFAYRVLDAQHFGVPQGRRRLFFVGRLGDDGRSPAQVLDLSEGSRGDRDPLDAVRPHAPYAAPRGATEGFLTYRKSQRAHNDTDFETWVESDRTNTLTLFDVGDTRSTSLVVTPEGRVRRLTPVEWERAQGFPDDWTAGQSDAQRYKQMGNAVAVPCVEWITRRIAALALAEIPRDRTVLDEHHERVADVGGQVAVTDLPRDDASGVPDLIGDADVA